MATTCTHLDQIRAVTPRTQGCEECLATGDTWVHLRLCLVCGQVGCCDSSKNKHATKHFHATQHAIMQSAQPGESWRWCFIDQMMV
jgi:hypothetical protein